MKKAWFHMLIVAARGPCHGAAIRRQDGTTIFWYAMPVERHRVVWVNEFFNRSVAGSDSSPWVAMAHTSVAPSSMRMSAW